MTRQAGVRCAGHTLPEPVECWRLIGAGAFFCGSSDPEAPSGCWREYYRQLVDPLFARRREEERGREVVEASR